MFKTKSTQPAPAPLVRSLAEADSEYAKHGDTLARLRGRLRDLEAEENTLRDRLVEQGRRAGSASTSRVAALLGDDPPEALEQPDGIVARLSAIAVERTDLRQAVDIATQRLQTARIAASTAICSEVEGEYRTRLTAALQAAIAAYRAHEEYLTLVDELTSQDVAWSTLQPMQGHVVYGHRGSRLATWLQDAARAGYLEKSEIPEGLRQ